MAVCPKCGFNLEGNESECPRCGVIIAKARPRPPLPSVASAEPLPAVPPPLPPSTPIGSEPSTAVKTRLQDDLKSPKGGATTTDAEGNAAQTRRSSLDLFGFILILISIIAYIIRPEFDFRSADPTPSSDQLTAVALVVFLRACYLFGIGALLIGMLRNRRLTTKPGSESARILRWVTCLPAGILAGFETMVANVSLIGLPGLSYTQTSALFASAVNMGLATAVALLVALTLAPSKKP